MRNETTVTAAASPGIRHALIIDDLDIRHAGFKRHFASQSTLADFQLHHAKTPEEAIGILRDARNPHTRIDTPGCMLGQPFCRHASCLSQPSKLTTPEPIEFTIIFFDHDCETGSIHHDFMPVVRAITSDPSLVPNMPIMWVHSCNPDGAESIRSKLAGAGFKVKVRPFEAPG